MAQNSTRIALLIDSDNVSAEHIVNILDELSRYGTTSVRRMYGDWTTEALRRWKTAANEHSIQPIQQFAYTTGKNATDSALIIDAMDLLHQNQLDAFAIVSSDSDFTRLAARLRESGARVFGFGQRKTPTPFVNACDTFTYLEVLKLEAEGSPGDSTETPSPKESSGRQARLSSKELRGDSRLLNLLRAGIAANEDDDGWANLGAVGSTIQKRSPDFDSRNWGYPKLSELIEAVGLFELDRVVGPGNSVSLLVRVPIKK